MATTEKLKSDSVRGKNGGARPGAGRPKGGMNTTTLERMAIKAAYQQKVLQTADKLFNAQMRLADGISYLYRIDKDSKGNNLRPVLVTIPGEIEDYLAGNEDGDSYYYITTERPDNRAIDSMLDRAFGKADANLDVTSGGEKLTVHVALNVCRQWVMNGKMVIKQGAVK